MDSVEKFMEKDTIEKKNKRGRKKGETIRREQAIIFKSNFKNLLNRLNTSYYLLRYPNLDEERTHRNALVGWDELPSYAALAHCNNFDPETDSLPTLGTVRKIVEFQNKNLVPSISVHDFLNKDLSAWEFNSIELSPLLVDPAFLRTYLGFYWGTELPGTLRIGLIKFYSEETPSKRWIIGENLSPEEYRMLNPNRLKTVMVAGLSSLDPQIISEAQTLIQGVVSGRGFKKYDADNKRFTVYHGLCEISANTLTAVMERVGASDQKCMLSVDLTLFRNSERKRLYLGGCGMMMWSAGQKVAKICLADEETCAAWINLEDCSLRNHLSPPFELRELPVRDSSGDTTLYFADEPIRLGRDDDCRWFEYLAAKKAIYERG